MRRFKILMIVSVLSLGIAGCEKTPLQKLASNTVYSDMNNVFWSKQQEKNTQLWKEASNYCDKYAEKPNCSSVILVATISNGNTKLVPLGN